MEPGKGANVVWFRVYEMFRTGRSIETESIVVTARG